MSVTKKLIIFIASIGVVCGVAAFIYGPAVVRSMAPQFFVTRAVTNTASEFMPLIDSLQTLAPKIQNEPIRGEVMLNIGRIDGGLAEEHIPPFVRPVISMLTLRSIVRRDGTGDNYNLQMSLQMAATRLLNADIYINRDRIALNVPMLFDYSIIADPRRLGSEIDDSVLAYFLIPGLIDDDLFYQLYLSAFFTPLEEIDIQAYIDDFTELIDQAEFEYLGREVYDIFYLSVPHRDLSATVYIDDSRLVKVRFDNANINFPEPGTVEFDFMEEAISGRLDFTGAGVNQVVNFNLTAPYVTTSGVLRLYPEYWRVEADIDRLNIALQDIDLSLNTRFTLLPDTEPVIFNDANARLLTDLDIFDLLAMYTEIGDSPLGGILGNVLP